MCRMGGEKEERVLGKSMGLGSPVRRLGFPDEGVVE